MSPRKDKIFGSSGPDEGNVGDSSILENTSSGSSDQMKDSKPERGYLKNRNNYPVNVPYAGGVMMLSAQRKTSLVDKAKLGSLPKGIIFIPAQAPVTK